MSNLHLKTEVKLNFVIPLYNEEEVFSKLIDRLVKVIESSHLPIEVILIDDGSSDDTPNLMKELSQIDKRFCSVILSRNFGHQAALTAGLSYVNASDAVMIIDGDLQDPPELIFDFYEEFKKGYDVVYAIRTKRKENILKRGAYKYFYKILKNISYIEVPLDSGDFSLISRRVVDILNQMPEESRYLRGMRTWIGFKQIGLEYERNKRDSGKSKYSLKKLFQLANNGIFNFSEYPIKVLLRIGGFAIVLSLVYLLYTLFQKIVFDSVPDGFTALLSVIILFGGVQLFALGLLGEYLLRVFFQVKGRPLFIVKEVLNGD